jgi:hypothetical protein
VTHVTGPSRHQATLLPESLDELIAQDHPVRVIDAFVDSLDLGHLGFKKVIAESIGRPPYAPGDLLKLHVYGCGIERATPAVAAATQACYQYPGCANAAQHLAAILGMKRCFCKTPSRFSPCRMYEASFFTA